MKVGLTESRQDIDTLGWQVPAKHAPWDRKANPA